MSLNFTFKGTAYLEEVGDIWSPEQHPYYGRVLRPEADYIVWSSAIIGIGRITEANVRTFIDRCKLADSVWGPTVKRWDEEKKQVVSAFDESVIRKCVGFGANVSTLTKAAFIRKITADMHL